MSLFARASCSLLIATGLAQAAAAQCTNEITLTIDGIHNPYLAGQPAGATSKSDTAPGASPFLVPLTIQPGDRLQFLNVSGDVWNLPGCCGPGPDGWTNNNFTVQPDLGISGYVLPENCLLGVFLDEQTNPGAAPPALDYSSLDTQNKLQYFPELYQVFFIGDGLGSAGAQQEWVVPPGATRLFLGSADGWNWEDNSGTFTFTIKKDDSLTTCTPTVSVASGGSQSMVLDAGPAFGGLPYLVLGSLSGTAPGTAIDSVLLPLNVDAHFIYTLTNANTAPLPNSFGSLDGAGKALADFTIPSGLPVSVIGTTFHHAFVVIELTPTLLEIVFASNAVPVTLFP